MVGAGFEELSLTFDVFLLLSFSDDVKNSSAHPVYSLKRDLCRHLHQPGWAAALTTCPKCGELGRPP
jgi:hypothetical protein